MPAKNGYVCGIFICPSAGDAMIQVESVMAIAGHGLEGDRYCNAAGSWNKGVPGKRQVTLMNGAHFGCCGFDYGDSRRNIITGGVELMRCIDKDFLIDGVRLRGVKYCEPCPRPSKLAHIDLNFEDVFHDQGGLIAEILVGGLIKEGSIIVPPPKKY